MRDHLSEEAFSTLINTVTVTLGITQTQRADELLLILPSAVLRVACQRAGLELSSFIGAVNSRFPRVCVQLTQELRQQLLAYGVYGLEEKDSMGRGKGAGNAYYLQLLDFNRCSVKYQRIIGGWSVGALTDDQSALLVTRVADGLKAQVQLEAAA